METPRNVAEPFWIVATSHPIGGCRVGLVQQSRTIAHIAHPSLGSARVGRL